MEKPRRSVLLLLIVVMAGLAVTFIASGGRGGWRVPAGTLTVIAGLASAHVWSIVRFPGDSSFLRAALVLMPSGTLVCGGLAFVLSAFPAWAAVGTLFQFGVMATMVSGFVLYGLYVRSVAK